MKYPLIIFDFDGTLADSFPWFKKTLNRAAEKYGFKRVAPEEFDALRSYDAEEILKSLGVSRWKTPVIGKYLRDLMTEEIDEIALFAGISGVLERLAEHGATLAVISSNAPNNVTQVLGIENAARIDYFECGVSLFGKPPKIRRVLSKSGIAPGDTIYVGDEVRDVVAAKSTQVAAGAVLWGYNRPEILRAHEPDVIFATVAEITEKLL